MNTVYKIDAYNGSYAYIYCNKLIICIKSYLSQFLFANLTSESQTSVCPSKPSKIGTHDIRSENLKIISWSLRFNDFYVFSVSFATFKLFGLFLYYYLVYLLQVHTTKIVDPFRYLANFYFSIFDSTFVFWWWWSFLLDCL